MQSLEAEASALSEETAYSVDDWLGALRRIGDRPRRDGWIRVVRDCATVLGASPAAVACWLIGDEGRPGVLTSALAAFGEEQPEPFGAGLLSALHAHGNPAHRVVIRPETIARMEAAARLR